MPLLRAGVLVGKLLHPKRFQEVLIDISPLFLGFTPSEKPQVLGICVIHNPQGIYYGGTIAAPVIKEVFENILPYMGIEG